MNNINDLILQHKGYVIKLASSYSQDYDERQDLQQEGYIGIMDAAEKYDPSVGTTFLSFAHKWIDGRMKKFLIRQMKAKGMTGRNDSLRKNPPIYDREKNNTESEYGQVVGVAERDPLSIPRRRDFLGQVLLSDFVKTLRTDHDRKFFTRRYNKEMSLKEMGTRFYYRMPSSRRYKALKNREQNIKRELKRFALSRPEIREYGIAA